MRHGRGGSIVVEGVRGSGRTTVLGTAAALAGQAGLTVAEARGSDVERDVPLALATRLLEPLWRATPAAERERLFGGPSAPAHALVDGAGARGGPPAAVSAEQLVFAAVALARGLVRHAALTAGGLALVIDDAHMADASSLRVIALLQADLDRLPLLVVLAVARGEWPRDHAVLSRMRAAADRRYAPPPLASRELARVLDAAYPGATPTLAEAVRTAAGGNPWLTAALLAELRERALPPDPTGVQRVLEAPGDQIADWIGGRLARLGPGAQTVARAVAVLDGQARLADVAAFTDLAPSAVASAADTLAEAGIFGPGEPLGYTAPLASAGALALLPPLARRSAHETAARVLLSSGGSPSATAAQLLRGGPLGDVRIPELLRAQAASSAAEDPARARALLSRALLEQPQAAIRAELLGELARAERRAGAPHAVERLAEARRLHPEPSFRHRAAIDEALARYELGEYRVAAAVIADEVTAHGALPASRAGADLRALYVCAASHLDDLRPSVVALRDAVLTDVDGGARGLQRAAVAHLFLLERLRGVPKAENDELAELAWGDGALLSPSLPALSIPALGFAMLIGDDAERVIELTGRVLDSRPPSGAHGHLIRAAALCLRAWAYLVRGDLPRAQSDAVSSLSVPVRAPFGFVWSGLAVLAVGALEHGDHRRAEEMISLLRCAPMDAAVREPLVRIAEARLALAERRPEVALAAATRAGDRLAGMGVTTLGPIQSWRAPAALAELMAGRRQQAAARAADALEISRTAGAPTAVIGDLHVAGLCAGVPAGLPALEEAVRLADTLPLRLEGIYALVGFGAALRRAGRREAARTVLRRALQRGREAGAEQLANLAEAELAAAGARERRRAQTGLGSLTPSQLRVVEMAGAGRTTRQMAEELVVSPKTIEFHLGQAYRKLGIGSRAELSGLLDRDGPARR